MVFPLDSQLQNPISALLDGLYCEEDRFLDDDLGEWSSLDVGNENVKKTLPLLECDMFWEHDELATLLSKENEFHLGFQSLISDGSLMGARKEALDWMLRVIAYYGFTATTAVLAVNYFDRFVSGLCFQKDKPWMSQLAAVACLSIAAKVEETQVPLLLDLQVADSRFVFEAKTIQRMELLVLSTLKWKMNLVTPLSFIDHIMRRFGFMSNLHMDFLKKCERLILDIITDSRLLHYPPSVIATASMFYVINEIEPSNAMEYQNQLMSVLKVRKDIFEECHDLILELMDTACYKLCQSLKRKHHSVPGSPSGVIDAYFSSESSNESWSVASSISSSPEPQYKRNKTQDQRMTLAPLGSNLH
ncbi:cyclin-D3-2 [Solanum pennellii]|uniref:Cyclin-D3-2 n=1 Tax=Solanum pennellii TaxID=28526 RepID=A0ABM1FY00_SOLPN|nr:cyclin-D3-2 [Solanum pennellii]